MSESKKNILILMTGSIACYKVCTLISKLKQAGHHIKVVMSAGSLQFIGSATIEGLTGEAPYTDMYAAGHAMEHINLQRWADLILVAPATANYINKIAAGIADDFPTTIFLAHNFQKPFLIAPAMNTQMYLHPTTQKSITSLKEMGVEILETASGVLACGETGFGRLLEPEHLLNDIFSRLQLSQTKNSSTENIEVLITAGGTSVPIDDVRFITNKSTGKTAATLADHLLASGLKVTYLHSKNAQTPVHDCKKQEFDTFDDLQKTLAALLQKNKYSFVIHSAAVSDYSVNPQNGKISSEKNELTLHLKQNPKIISEIKKQSPNSKLIGFKLTSTPDADVINKKVSDLFDSASCDYVVQNDWNDIKNNLRRFKFYKKDSKLSFEKIDSTENLSAKILKTITSQLQETL